MRIWFILPLLLTLGCVEVDSVKENQEYLMKFEQTGRDQIQKEREKEIEEAKRIVAQIPIGEKILVRVENITEINQIYGIIDQTEPDSKFDIIDPNIWVDFSKNLISELDREKGKKLLNNLVKDNCEFWVTVSTVGCNIFPFYDDYYHRNYNPNFKIEGEIEIRYQGKSKTLKQILIEQEIIDNAAQKVFDTSTAEIFP